MRRSLDDESILLLRNGLGLFADMTSKADLESVASASRRGRLNDHLPIGTLSEFHISDARYAVPRDPDGTAMQSMGQAVGWLSGLLLSLSFAVGGYLALTNWPDGGTSRRPLVAGQATTSPGDNIAEPQVQVRMAPKTVMSDRDVPATKLNVGAVFRDLTIAGEPCPICPEMIVVPAGSFVIGAGAGEPWQEEWQAELETPTVKVTVSQPFAVGRYAVTFDEWEMCVAEQGCTVTPNDNGWGRANRPVVNISWDEALQYARWLSTKTGKTYRLLSEAEREYVTRAGTTTAFWFGQAPSPKRANYLWDRTMPVDSLTPNAWGLFHVHGNVSGWTADCWNSNHRGRSGLSGARTTGDCKRRVVKGGAWFNSPNLLRSAARIGLNAATRYKTVGLRVARAIGDGN